MNWFVLYTRPRFEKKVVKDLSGNGFEVYLPLKKEIRQWSDRKKWIEEPLFRGYVFVKSEAEKLPAISQMDGVVSPVTFNGKPAEVRDDEIKSIEQILAGPESFHVDDMTFTRGEVISIVQGPLKGLTGKWINYRGSKRIAIQIEQLQKCLVLEVPVAYIKKG